MVLPKTTHNIALFISWSLSVIATAVSLYWSEFLHWAPCTLCWLERFCMYPIALILTISLVVRVSRTLIYGGAVLASMGFGLGVYHMYLTLHPAADVQVGFCSVSVPCSKPAFTMWDLITPALLSAVAFFMVFVLLLLHMYRTSEAQGR
jgi:disulfide bond formation protein DsbB